MSNLDTTIQPPDGLQEIYCITEGAIVSTYGKDLLFQCPNNAGHAVYPGSSQTGYYITPITQAIPLSKSSYFDGTATRSGNTVTGVGTTFTSAMIGGLIVFSSANGSFITGVTSGTSLTTKDSGTETGTGNYIIYYGGFQVDYNGDTVTNNLQLQGSSNQLTLGAPSGNTTTLTAAVPSSSQVLTIPDSGKTTANVILSQGTQTLSGNYTLNSTSSNALNLGRGTVALSWDPSTSPGVTCNGISGIVSVTTKTTAITPGNAGSFVINNSVVSSTSVVTVHMSDWNLGGNSRTPLYYVSNVSSGSFTFNIINGSALLTNFAAGSSFKVNFFVS
jgi:hypothetical protein